MLVQIGEWNSKSGLHIKDVTWPGSNTSPPSGRPPKYNLKVVTLEERPYVIYSDIDSNGLCPTQAELCSTVLTNISDTDG